MPEPSGGDPFDEGFEAFGRGAPREDCPYPEGSDERKIWEEGWDEAESVAEEGGLGDEN